MVYADELVDLFDNFELSVEKMEPHYPEEMILAGEEVREFLAYKFMKLAAQIKMEGT
jgi:hypothetical protein